MFEKSEALYDEALVLAIDLFGPESQEVGRMYHDMAIVIKQTMYAPIEVF